MKAIIIALALTVYIFPAAASIVVQESVSCLVGASTQSFSSTQLGSLACSQLKSPPNYVSSSAHVDGSASISGNQVYFTASASVNLEVQVFGDPTPRSASGFVSISDSDLYTLGPERPGIAQVFLLGGASLTAATAGGGTASAFGLTGYGNEVMHPVFAVIPVNLGTPFSLSLSVFTIGGNYSGGASATGQITLFEADGTTPVQIFDAPEPATWSLAMVGLLALGFKRRTGRA